MNKDTDVARLSNLRTILSAHGFQFKKQLGQNFLVDNRILDAIVDAAELSPTDGAFEVGPGAGVVTSRLGEVARKVVAVEKDKSLAPVLESVIGTLPNVDIIFDDVLELNLRETWELFSECDRVSVVANLPYYVTTPILFHLLESKLPIHNIVIMVQREVAERLAAPPGGKDYGALSVAVQYYAEVERVVKVPPSSFLPPPNVDSAVVRLRMRAHPPVQVEDEKLFFRVVRGAFSMRRKTLLNNMTHTFPFSKQECEALLRDVGIEPSRRGETLTLSEFAAIANAYDAFKRDINSSE